MIANRPDSGLPEEYEHKLKEAMESHHLTADESVLFIEVRPGDVSDFSDVLQVRGHGRPPPRAALREPGDSQRHRGAAAACPRSDRKDPHAHFGWTEGNPIAYLLKFAFGEGDTAPVTREV